MIGFGRYFFRRGLQRRIFVWFGISIAITACVVARVMGFPGNGSPIDRARQFLADRFALSWTDPAARDELVRAVARDLSVGVDLTDAAGTPLSGARVCRGHAVETEVRRDGVVLGYVTLCDRGDHRRWGWAPVLIAVAMLWAASGAISRRLARPLLELSRVAQEIGRGHLKSRVALSRHTATEFALVGHAMNEMASRIEKQLADQRALLATVSHEIRTPLARMRLLIAMAAERAEPSSPGASPPSFAQIEREILEIDTLVGDLLASSRLDFDAVTRMPLDARKIAADALERADVDVGRLVAPAGDATFSGDATLVARAVSNLLENAKRHGAGVRALRVELTARSVAFIVADCGSGFEPGEEQRAFEPFYRRASRPSDGAAPAAESAPGSVGLGLALVRRIAEAHQGRAFARNLPGGGAEVGIEIARDGATARA